MTPIIHHSVKDKTMETVSGGSGLGRETTFLEKRNYIITIVMIRLDMYHYTLVKFVEFKTQRINHNVKYKHLVMMYECRFINYNKSTTLLPNVDNGRDSVRQDKVYMGTVCIFPFQCNPQIAFF